MYLCEKPSQGKDIAAVLGAKTRGDGCLRGPGVAVTWGIGHLLETAAPDAYGDHLKNWSLDTLPILPAQWKVIVKPKTASQFWVVRPRIGAHGVSGVDTLLSGAFIGADAGSAEV
ncbi:DNA topoisomerase III, partial [Pseudomonas syringae pv. pisi str. 1704B]